MNQTTFQRNWTGYNKAQTSEKLLVLRIINDAVSYMQVPYIYKGNGRPSISMDDMLKCCVIKVFNNFSSRRTMPDLQIAKALGYIQEVPHFNIVSKYMRDENMTPWIHRLYKTLSLPLVDIENNFAVDATGISLLQKKNWLELKLDKIAKRDFKKLHIISGVQTNVVTSAQVTDGYRHDSLEYKGMVVDTSKRFRIREVLADAGYLSRENCRITEEIGGIPFILPKKDTRTTFDYFWTRKAYAWQRMITFWHENKEEFLEHYHMRSNVESTFSAIKRKFLPYVRSKNEQSQINEILYKVVCHNASVLCNVMFELNINLSFERRE